MAETVGIFFSANVEAFKVYYSGIFFLIPGLFRRCHLIRSSFLSHHVSIKPTYLYHDVPCGSFSSLKRCKESRGGTEQRFRVFFFFFWMLVNEKSRCVNFIHNLRIWRINGLITEIYF